MSNVHRFGATGDGVTDDTEAVRHALRDGDGMFHFPPGTYRITEPIDVVLAEHGPVAIQGTGGTARIVMAGKGPALRLIGTHTGTGSPHSVTGNVYPNQRRPMVGDLVIEGEHAEADGIELVQTMQSVLSGLLIRHCRHAIRLTRRNRNVVISHCHLYHNTGVGVFLDGVNLHQINVQGNHISYNRLGGIRIERSEVRNLQITGNDIEYNNHDQHGTEPQPTAEIFIDCTQEGASVNEVTIASNTIQATDSAGGCNIRVHELTNGGSRPPGLICITGNVIGSQENNIRITGGYGITVTGNTIYSCRERNLLLEDSRQITIGANVFRRHTPTLGTGIRIVRSRDIVISGCSLLDEAEDGQESGASLLEVEDCERVNVNGNQLTGGVPCGISVSAGSLVSITSNIIHDARTAAKSRHAIRWSGPGSGNLVATNTVGPTLDEPLQVSAESNVHLQDNLTAG